MRFANFQAVYAEAKRQNPVRVSVAAAHDVDVLTAIKQAVELGLIDPILVGDKAEIQRIAEDINFDLRDFAIYQVETEDEAAYLAAKLANEGAAKMIMKGFINSTPFLKGVLHKDFHLHSQRLLSHVAAFEIPGFSHLYFITDGGINIMPDLSQKEQIVSNAVEYLHLLGIKQPKVALLSANERVSEKMPVTLQWKRLTELATEGRFGEALIEGPLPLDLAINKESARHKGIPTKIEGDADLLVVPEIDTGNALSKSITYFAKGTMAGVVLGAKVPLILNSRSDSADAKLASIALAVVAVNAAKRQVGLKV